MVPISVCGEGLVLTIQSERMPSPGEHRAGQGQVEGREPGFLKKEGLAEGERAEEEAERPQDQASPLRPSAEGWSAPEGSQDSTPLLPLPRALTHPLCCKPDPFFWPLPPPVSSAHLSRWGDSVGRAKLCACTTVFLPLVPMKLGDSAHMSRISQ